MSNYTAEPVKRRVDFFKPSGKWYTSISVDMTFTYNKPDIVEALKLSIWRTSGTAYSGMKAVCLEPYHQNSCPLMIDWEGKPE